MSKRKSTQQLELPVAQAPTSLPTTSTQWAADERKQIKDALWSAEYMVATSNGSGGDWPAARFGTAVGAEAVHIDSKWAVLDGLAELAGAVAGNGEREDRNAQWLATEDAQRIYPKSHCTMSADARTRAAEHHAKAAALRVLMDKVERTPVAELPIDHAAIAKRAARTAENATVDLDPSLADTLHQVKHEHPDGWARLVEMFPHAADEIPTRLTYDAYKVERKTQPEKWAMLSTPHHMKPLVKAPRRSR